jgi:dolichol-phosphate mannosyltransferase
MSTLPVLSPSAEPARIHELSAVMPAYNEEDVLSTSLAETVSALDALCDRWELIVVDDGSTDATASILAERCARNPRVRALRQPHNLGYSKALIRGFRAARHELVFYTDADAQFDVHDITALHACIDDVDMVVGYRIDRQDATIRRLTSAVYNRLMAVVLGVSVRDCNCAFKMFRRGFLHSLPLRSDGFLIDAELFAQAKAAGGRWREVGIVHRPRERGSSKVRWVAVAETLRGLWAVRRSIVRSRASKA